MLIYAAAVFCSVLREIQGPWRRGRRKELLGRISVGPRRTVVVHTFFFGIFFWGGELLFIVVVYFLDFGKKCEVNPFPLA